MEFFFNLFALNWKICTFFNLAGVSWFLFVFVSNIQYICHYQA